MAQLHQQQHKSSGSNIEVQAAQAADSDGSDGSTTTATTPVKASTRALKAAAWGEGRGASWQQYHQQASAVDQQVSELEARLEVACSSSATPLAVREMH